MRQFTTIFATTAIALLMTACSQTPPDTHDADVKAIQDQETQWNQDYVSKDSEKIAAHYADDAVLMAPGTPATTSKDTIRTMLKGMASDPALSLKFHASKIDVAKSGDLAYTQGSYTMTMTDPQTKQIINDHGSYVTTYRKQPDGSWKAVVDIATSEVPPPAPAPPPPTARH